MNPETITALSTALSLLALRALAFVASERGAVRADAIPREVDEITSDPEILTDAVEGLLLHGLVEIVDDPDDGRILLYATKEGHRVVAEVQGTRPWMLRES